MVDRLYTIYHLEKHYINQAWLGWLAGAPASQPVVDSITPQRLAHLHLMEGGAGVSDSQIKKSISIDSTQATICV
jgi:hypothetical protein